LVGVGGEAGKRRQTGLLDEEATAGGDDDEEDIDG
jgi:hypothetical protein